MLPSFEPGYECDDCGDIHPNKGYKKKAAFKCGNCGQFAGSDKAKCRWCGERDWEELDEDEQSLLPEPKAHGHDE